MDKDRVVGLNDLPCCELERRSSNHKGIFFEVPLCGVPQGHMRTSGRSAQRAPPHFSREIAGKIAELTGYPFRPGSWPFKCWMPSTAGFSKRFCNSSSPIS